MATKTITAKLTKKAGTNNKGFQLEGEDGWFNATDKSAEYLGKIEVGKIVEVTYFEKEAGKRAVTIIKEIEKKESVKEEPKAETGKKLCPICKKTSLTGNYPTCWDCKDKKAEVKKDTPKPQVEEPKEERKSNTYSFSDAKTAQIQRGNALNAAAAVMSNPSLNIADTSTEGLIQATLITADRFLNWLRAE